MPVDVLASARVHELLYALEDVGALFDASANISDQEVCMLRRA